jgi:hypothetical protein
MVKPIIAVSVGPSPASYPHPLDLPHPPHGFNFNDFDVLFSHVFGISFQAF